MIIAGVAALVTFAYIYGFYKAVGDDAFRAFEALRRGPNSEAELGALLNSQYYLIWPGQMFNRFSYNVSGIPGNRTSLPWGGRMRGVSQS